MSDYEIIIVCAVRYALGRRTYITSLVCEYVLNHIDALTKACLWLIATDIHNQKQWGYGDECDEQKWMELLELIEGRIRQREDKQ